DPQQPSTLYAGIFGEGVFKSVNGGAAWTPFNNGLTNPFVTTLAVDPIIPSTLYAGTAEGVFAMQQQPVPDYALSNSGGITVRPGASGSTIITATLAGESSPGVSFTASGLPSGATASFTSGACAPTCSTQLNIATSPSTPTGTFPITVTG